MLRRRGQGAFHTSLCQPAKIKFCLLIKHLNGLKLAALRQQPCLDGAMVGKILFLNAGRQKLRWGKLPDRALGQWPLALALVYLSFSKCVIIEVMLTYER